MTTKRLPCQATMLRDDLSCGRMTHKRNRYDWNEPRCVAHNGKDVFCACRELRPADGSHLEGCPMSFPNNQED